MRTSTASLTDRMIGAARLDAATYEAVEHDEGATTSAFLVVLAAAIAAGIGGLLFGGITQFFGGIVLGIVGWAVYAAVAYVVGTRLFATAETRSTWGELLRTLGFAQAPKLLLIFGWIPIIGWILWPIVGIWLLFTTVIAIRQALDFTTGRAIGTAVVAWIVYIVLQAIGSIFI